MKRSVIILSSLILAVSGATALPAQAAAPPRDSFEVYTAVVSAAKAGELARDGADIVDSKTVGDQVQIDLVAGNSERDRLAKHGVELKVKLTKDGKTTRQLITEQAAAGYKVWRSWDQPGGIRDELYALAHSNPNLLKLEVLGKTGQGREIIAVKLTQGAREVPDASRPAVLYSSTQHAREWISTEVN